MNPYKVLGLPVGASLDDVKAAYKRLAMQYQNDSSPAAAQKMDELNQAYDTIIMNYASSDSYYNEGNKAESEPDYSDIRSRINSGKLDEAQILLDGIPEFSRDAQWYYLKGTVMQKRGWLEEAANNFSTACHLDPENKTYKSAYNRVFNNRNGGYRVERNSRRNRNDDKGCLRCCCELICADACCECMGGDLIPCC